MAAMGETQQGRLVVDLQHVFGDRDTPWTTPRFDGSRPRIRRLVDAFGDFVVRTRLVAPAGMAVGESDHGHRRRHRLLRPRHGAAGGRRRGQPGCRVDACATDGVLGG